jgi:hypothetical protein
MPPTPAAPPPPAAAPTHPVTTPVHPAAAGYPQQQPVTPPPGFAPPPLGAYGAPQPPTESPTAPVLASPPTVQLQPEPPSFDTPPPGPVVTSDPQPEKEPEPKRKGGVSWKVLLTVALVMAIGGTAGGVVLMKKMDDGKANKSAADNSPQVVTSNGPASPKPTPTGASDDEVSSSPTASPSKSSGASKSPSAGSTVPRNSVYTVVYQDTELYATSYSYSFDLSAGKVVPDSNNPTWALDPTGMGSFDLDSNSDAYISRDNTLTPQTCSAAIDREPTKDLKFDDLPPGRLFCLRNRKNGGIVIAKVIEQGNKSTGAVKLSLSYWRNDG